MKQSPHDKTRKSEGSRSVGLARALSKLGYCSRQRAAGLIRDSKVRLNGSIAKNPEAPVRLGLDRIEVQGRRVEAAEKVYVMLNKPRGIVTSADDQKARDTVYMLLPADGDWLAPVGRLDKASEGLLLMTNDSQWGARITEPATHLDKTYHVQISAIADEALLGALRDGVETERGELLRCTRVNILRKGEKNSWLEIVLDEGKNRQIRRMLHARGVEVLRLIRVAIGPLLLGDLTKGAHRRLTAAELESLQRTIS